MSILKDINFQYFAAAAFFATMFSPQASAQPLDLAASLGGIDGFTRLGIFLSCGLIGMIGHYLKMWLRDEITNNLFAYLFKDKPKNTFLAIFALVGANGTAFLLGQLDTLTVAQLILTGFMVGYTCDSALNNGKGIDTTVDPIQIVGK